MRQGRSIAGPLITLAALGAVGAFYLYINVDSYATKVINGKLRDAFQGSRFSAVVREADIVEGTGIVLRGFQLSDLQRGRNKVFTAEKVIVRVPTDIQELLRQRLEPELIEVRRARLELSQSDDLEFWLKELSLHLQQHHNPGKDCPVLVRDSEIAIKLANWPSKFRFSKFEADVLPNEQGRLQIVAKASGDHESRLETRVLIDKPTGRWQAEITSLQATLNPGLIAYVPQSFRSQLSGLQIAGKLRSRGIVRSQPNGLSPKFEFACELSNLYARKDSFPVEINQCNSQITLNNTGLQVKRATGRAGDASFDLKYGQTGWQTGRSWTVAGNVNNLAIGAEAIRQLPGAERFFHDFEPSGMADLQFELNSAGANKISADIKDASFKFHRFPYPISQCAGKVQLKNDRLDFQFRALEQQQELEFDGKILNPGHEQTFVVNFRTDGRLPIDEKLVRAIKFHPNLARIANEFDVLGYLSGTGTIRRNRPGGNDKRSIEVQLHDCGVRYKRFDYPFQKVQGELHITDDRVAFHDVFGINGKSQTQCNGVWDKLEGLQLVFNYQTVAMDNLLRNALPPSLQSVWDGLRPSGTVQSGKVFVNYPASTRQLDVRLQAEFGKADPSQAALPHDGNDLEPASIYPTWFPYRMDDLAGSVQIGGGVINVQNFLGRHERTRVSCQANGQYSNSGWNISLTEMLAGSVTPNHDFLRALPPRLAEAIQMLEFDGKVTVSGNMAFAQSGMNEPPEESNQGTGIKQVGYQSELSPVSSAWDLRLDIDQGNMSVGLPLENVFGSVQLKGRDSGNKSESAGNVSVDSMTVYGVQVTNVQGPIWIDNHQTLAGIFANGNDGETKPLVGELFGGKVSFDGWVSHDGSSGYPFKIQTTVEKSQLEDLAAEIAPQFRELSGDGYGFLQLTGNANELHTYTGSGNIHLRDAKIHQLPVVLSLLKILGVKEPSRNAFAFDSSNVDFSVKGKQLKLERIELIGDAISLIGNGYMELMRHVDANFYSVLGRNRVYIPIVSELYRAGSQRILWINIGGPLSALQTSRKVLPGLDDSLKQLLNNNPDSGPGAWGANTGRNSLLGN